LYSLASQILNSVQHRRKLGNKSGKRISVKKVVKKNEDYVSAEQATLYYLDKIWRNIAGDDAEKTPANKS
jgi:hypothetical protein